MHRLRFPFLVGVIAPILLALLMKTGLTDAAAASHSAAWTIVASPNAGSRNNTVNGVAAVSVHDVWAVGSYFNSNSRTYQPFTEQRNGSGWTVVYTTVAASSSGNCLSGVTAIGKNNLSAVGYDISIDQTTSRTLTEHWNGTQWSVVPSPNKGTH